MEAESQAMLNTLTEHDFQDAFKNGISAGNGAFARKGTTSRVITASRLKVSIPDGSSGPVNYAYVWYLHGVVLS
jgi:hypothetical protein